MTISPKFIVIIFSLMLMSYQVASEEMIHVELQPMTDKQKKIGKYHKKPDDFINLIIKFDGKQYKHVIWKENNLTSVPFSKVVMCGNQNYPSVLVRNIRKDIASEYYSNDQLFVFNESLKKIKAYSESISISNEYTNSPDKFAVDIQPKFTLDNVEGFVCSSQVNLCDQGDRLRYQCTFKDGRQANMCNKGGGHHYPNYFRLGNPNQLLNLEANFALSYPQEDGDIYTKNKYKTLETLDDNTLQSVDDSVSFFNEAGTDYAFENHWRASSLEDYDFHAEFNIRQNGVIVESHRCLEGSYE